jgi:hypothetical protein
MLRTVFTIGLFALLGLFALNLAFAVLPMVIGLVMGLLSLALKIALFGLVVYVLIRIFSPETARRMRERWSGSSM